MPRSRRLLPGDRDFLLGSGYGGFAQRLLRDEGGAGRRDSRPGRRALFARRAIRRWSLAQALRLPESIERTGAGRARLHDSFGRGRSGSSREPHLFRRSSTLVAPLQYLESAAGASPSRRYRSVLTVRTHASAGSGPPRAVSSVAPSEWNRGNKTLPACRTESAGQSVVPAHPCRLHRAAPCSRLASSRAFS